MRVVEIKGLDSNMCCGTHVASLSHLQVRGHAHLRGRGISSRYCAVVCEAVVHRVQEGVNVAVLCCGWACPQICPESPGE